MSSKPIWVVTAVLSLVAGASSQRSLKLRSDPVAIPRVWIVDEDGPADFVVLQEAIDAASSGDVIRVRTDWPVDPIHGGHTMAVVDGKGLFIVGEGSSRPRIAHRLIGGDGGIVEDSFLFAAGSTFLGGAAGYSVPAGDGISVEGRSDVQALECVFVGGQGYGGPFIPPGIPGQPIDGTVTELAGVARSYRIDPPISTDGSATLTATGPAGETVVSIVGTEPSGVYLPLHLGSLPVDPPITVQVEGTIPATGALVQRISLPLPARGQALATQYRQGVFFDSGGGAFLGSGSAVVILP